MAVKRGHCPLDTGQALYTYWVSDLVSSNWVKRRVRLRAGESRSVKMAKEDLGGKGIE